MSWRCFRVRFRLRSDMHCGSLALGFVARAFPFVPQHVPLYAVVPAAVAALKLPDSRASYRSVEKLVLGAVRFTPFFVLYGAGETKRPLFPWVEEDRAVLESDFMGARYGVGLDDAARSAEEGRLFETEVLLAHSRGSMNATEMEGYVWLRSASVEGLCLDAEGMARGNLRVSWPALLGALSLGGDRTRSLGRLVARCGDEGVRLPVERHDHAAGRLLALSSGESGNACPVVLEAEGLEGSGSPTHGRAGTGRRIRENGGYGMDKGTVARDMGWIPREDMLVELCAERFARRCASDG